MIWDRFSLGVNNCSEVWVIELAKDKWIEIK